MTRALSFLIPAFILIICHGRLSAHLMINEFVTNTPSDWVELVLPGPTREKMDISKLYVTTYYGKNEPLSADPVTIYSYNRPETPYDDRYIVVHLTQPGIPDETDLTGDTNGNKHIDIYCNNYSASLWNTEGVIAIDSDDDPSNGGIIDFVYYSNRDGSPNETITSYVQQAAAQGQWRIGTISNVQLYSVFIGREGLSSYMSMTRRSTIDLNVCTDFIITNIPTPGRANTPGPIVMGKRLFKLLRKTITIIPGHPIFGSGAIPVFVFFPCCFKLRIFSSTGILVHESPLFTSVNPGNFNLYWNPQLQGRHAVSGLYICKIEAVNIGMRLNAEETMYIIMSRYQ